MGLDFLDDAKEIKIRGNDYKQKVDEKLENINKDDEPTVGINILDIDLEKKTKKIAMTIYLEEEKMAFYEAISNVKSTTIQRTINAILDNTEKATKANLPDNFDIDQNAKEYRRKNKVKRTKK